MAQLDGPGLHAEIDARFQDNTTQLITPPVVRAFLHNLVDSALLAASDKIALSLPLTLAQARALLTAAPPRVGAGQFYAVTGNWNGSGTTSTVYVEGLNHLTFQLEGVLFSAGTYSKVLVDVLAGTAVSATMLRSLHTFRWHTQAEGVGNYGGESLDQLKGEELFAQAQVLVEFWRDNPLDLTSDVIYNQQFIVQYDPRPTPEYYGWRTSGGAANNAGRIGLRLSKVENPYATAVKQYFANQSIKAGDVRFNSDAQGVAFYEATQNAVAPVPAPVRGQTTANWKPAASPPPPSGGPSSFAALAGAPADNPALAAALNSKATLDGNGKILRSQLLQQHKYTYNYPAGQTTAPEYRIIDYDAAGYYAIEVQSNTNINGYYLNDVLVAPAANGTFLLATQDRFRIDATAPAGLKGTILLSQVL